VYKKHILPALNLLKKTGKPVYIRAAQPSFPFDGELLRAIIEPDELSAIYDASQPPSLPVMVRCTDQQQLEEVSALFGSKGQNYTILSV